MMGCGAAAAAGVVVAAGVIGGAFYFKHKSDWTYENAREEVFKMLRDQILIEKVKFV